MKDLYSIGETAKLLGITVQTLRFYSKTQLLQPKYIDPSTGYRYYSFDQFHYIDRIKYLQSFGIPLSSIRTVIESGSVDKLLPILEQQLQQSIQDLHKIQETIHDIEWYIRYFTYLQSNDMPDSLYKVRLPERYALQVPCYAGEPLQNMEIRLIEQKYSETLRGLHYLRQFGYVLDLENDKAGDFQPKSIYMFLKHKPAFEDARLITFPAGEYLCFRSELLTGDWDASIIKNYLQAQQKEPVLVLANEYEDNLVEYTNAVYEIQCLIQP